MIQRLLSFLLLLPSVALAQDRTADQKFIVHEWGVMVHDHVESNVLAAPNEFIASLPSFVFLHQQAYAPTRTDHGWKKPILYFYGPDQLSIQVRLDTAAGNPLAYFPRPDSFLERQGEMIVNSREMMAYSLSQAVGMQWSFTLSRDPQNKLAEVDPSHWWSAARNVPCSCINSKTTSERFLFYEATAKQEPTLLAHLSADSLTLHNTANTPSGTILILINDGKTHCLHRLDSLEPGKEITLPKNDLTTPASDKDILQAATTACILFGLSGPEARALVDAWKTDLTTRLGFLIISRLPALDYDKIFPLTITPRPAETLRVGLIFDTLPAQDARASWLPNLAPILDSLGQLLASDDFPTREQAAKHLASYGDLAKPYLQSLLTNKDPEVARAATILLEQLTPKPTTQPASAGEP